MLPRRHILDVWELVGDDERLLSMVTVTLAVDAVKYLDKDSKRDHLVDALELNEFVCYMFPGKRPENRSLLYHVVSDLLGLLLYGVPRKKKSSIENLETVNYSEKNMNVAPITNVWNTLKADVYNKKHGPRDIVEGYIKKIRVEMAVMEGYPFLEDLFYQSRGYLKQWLPCLARYHETTAKPIKNLYDRWWTLWLCGAEKEQVLTGMVDRLCAQAEKEFLITLDKARIFETILRDPEGNRQENERFSKWYRQGVDLLFNS
jgi:hypothetical protein